MTEPRLVVVGGGFVGRAVAARARARGAQVELVDRRAGPPELGTWHELDVLVDDVALPPGRVVLSIGDSNPRPRRGWECVLTNAMTAARVAPHLDGRDVVLISSAEVYGATAGALTEQSPLGLPVDEPWLTEWVDRALQLAHSDGPPHRFEDHCRALAGADPNGRWVYAMAKHAQELAAQRSVDPDRLTVLRVANVIGPGQVRAAARFALMAEAALPLRVSEPAQRTFLALGDLVDVVLDPPGPGVWNVGGHVLPVRQLAKEVLARLDADATIAPVPPPSGDTSGVVDDTRLRERRAASELAPAIDAVVDAVRERSPVFDPAIPVIAPPRPARPAFLSARMAGALATGELKAGRRWSRELQARLTELLGVGEDRRLDLFGTGTAALHCTMLATCGRARPGDVAVVPSFTYPVTAQIAALLGYDVRFADVDPGSWTIDPNHLATVLTADTRAVVVVGVDTLGNPLDYDAVQRVCDEHGVTLLADSAAAIGAEYRDRPVGTQAAGHAFSMSFAKVLSAGGAGGVAIVSAGASVDPAALGLAPLSELHAVAAVDQLDVLPELLAVRARVAAIYDELLGDVVTPQRVTSGARHARVHYSALLPRGVDRDAIRAGLDRFGVRTGAYFSPALHAELPVSADLARRVISLPLSSEMTPEQAELVAFAVRISLRDAR